MKYLIFFIISCLPVSLVAQHLKSFNSVGLIAGESRAGLEVQTVNGISWSHFFSGVGVGLDEYFYKTVPVFADGRYFFSKSRATFVFAGAGYNYPLKNQSKQNQFSSLKPGFYTSFGIGHETRLSDEIKVFFAIGHSYKGVTERQSTGSVCIGCPAYTYEQKNTLGRITMKTGISF